MSEWWRSEPRGAIPVEDGLVARSGRGTIGASWWSRRFLDVLESFGMQGRLSRGKTYARKGQVISLDVSPGVVRSVVQGSRPQPYATSITLAPFDDAQWDAVLQAMGAQAVFAARLLAGDLPDDLEDVVASAGAALFPASSRDLRMDCSCPDVGNPCKHLAATMYLLAESFDDDPFRILLWRGRSREQVLAALDVEAAPARRALPVGTAAALADVPATPPSAERFWVCPVHPGTRPAPLDAPADLLLRQLPEPPAAIGGPALRQWLQEAYRALPHDDA